MTDTIDFFPITVEQTDWQSSGDLLTRLRHRVFVEEQGVPESEELDGKDGEALHWIAWGQGDVPMGTARLVGNRIGRMAVLEEYRDKGVGSALLRAIINHALRTGLQTLVLDAQTHALRFYRGVGFETTGPEFMDAGIPHRPMALDLPRFSHRRVEPQPASVDDELRRRIAVESADDFARHAEAIARGSDRAIRLFSDQLDRALYDQEGFCEGVLRLATRHPNAEVMILVRDTADLVSRHHRLVELFLRLTSRIQLRKLNPERETLHTEFLVGDEESVLYNQLAGGYQGYYYRYAPLEARRLGQDFDSLWDSSAPDPAIRRLHI
ncbi:MAG: GNAT family N-acetyltransferase [Porticoccaceae bacterium]|jgi:predicted GNAT family N-acyltransferase|nr:GNAT family N-acetyltransferase [Porticoccaceae bacterium]MEA3300994.1 GNAT family N-acetyltransferase [Pseudomonadota bacterium]HLS98581.1 GNAT family N-acetyltransferase [Porticoccaceae bacterium]